MTSRRQFLGAAAAVWGLPHGDQLRLYTDTPPSDIRDGEGEKEFPREVRHEGFSGSLTAENYSDEVNVSVEMYPSQTEIPVALEVFFGAINMGAAMEPDEARKVGQSLIDAANEVEEWRESHWDDHMMNQYGGGSDGE
ncbi:hypothetical protein [Haloferax sulfurifontis]|uniref:Uncharacterized protein n=2 Tax=Haloferax sulfurifontis TaxID=255616 RepID=M0IIJ4_9EURY|nr:hypothetical protein [Haloferax sulfurifontis]ELZ96565.1 hypothetical protein C441_04334 [Haloferax sulfurifontis ATCC BAA-897]GGC72835.1 hypothetical protein GCM10007209_38500 [Haloferax sulfurifontis]